MINDNAADFDIIEAITGAVVDLPEQASIASPQVSPVRLQGRFDAADPVAIHHNGANNNNNTNFENHINNYDIPLATVANNATNIITNEASQTNVLQGGQRQYQHIARLMEPQQQQIGQADNSAYMYEAATSTHHGTDWFINQPAMMSPINGPYPTREWGVRTPVTGEILRAGGNIDKRRSRLDIIFLMFPPAQLNIITRETNKHLHLIGRNATTKGEVIRFLGVIVLMTRYEFRSRASLWSLRP